MTFTMLDGEGYRRFVLAATHMLEQKRAEIDALNVFPVPDGDTGANMALTMTAARQEATKAESRSLTDVAESVSLGSLMGARGNSGVILSQLFRGFAKGVSGKQEIDGSGLAVALSDGVNTAYEAVMRPVEGTMLTVAREAAKAAEQCARKTKDVVIVLEAALAEAKRSLQRTPELLPVLKRAGVVDAGGKGLVHIFEAWLSAVRDEDLVIEADVSGGSAPVVDGTEEVGEYFYDSQLLVRGTGIDLEALRSQLEPLGDSLLVVGSDTLAKVHVHTLQPGTVLDLCLGWGDIDQVEILDMRQQHAEFVAGRQEAGESSEVSSPVVVIPEQLVNTKVGVVAVVLGKGLMEIFQSLGAAAVVQGGQTMNPSIEDILSAINSLQSETIVVLPNNKNVIPAAEQAAKLSGRTVRVLPTRTIPQGVSALFALRPDCDADANIGYMKRAMSEVKTGLVTFAVRDAVCEKNGVISEGSIIGLVEGKIEVSGSDRNVVASDVVKLLADEDTEVVTLFYGEGVTSAEAEALAQMVSEQVADHEVEIRYGGQPHYYYIISME